jgi:hypothetical protein
MVFSNVLNVLRAGGLVKTLEYTISDNQNVREHHKGQSNNGNNKITELRTILQREKVFSNVYFFIAPMVFSNVLIVPNGVL